MRIARLRKKNWMVYAKPPFAGPEAVLAYLPRYTHRVAISNRRLIALDERGVTFRYKDYRRDGAARYGTMTLNADEFIRRFLLHVLPKGFHRIRHYGLLASGGRKDNIAHARQLYPAHVRIRKFFGFMMRKLSATASHQVVQFSGTSLRKKCSIAPQKSVKLA